MLDQIAARADTDKVAALQALTARQTNDLLTRYGARLALTGTTTTPLTTATPLRTV